MEHHGEEFEGITPSTPTPSSPIPHLSSTPNRLPIGPRPRSNSRAAITESPTVAYPPSSIDTSISFSPPRQSSMNASSPLQSAYTKNIFSHPSTFATPSSPPTSSPLSSRPQSSHAPGILPPAAFFRAVGNRPKSNSSSLTASLPIRRVASPPIMDYKSTFPGGLTSSAPPIEPSINSVSSAVDTSASTYDGGSSFGSATGNRLSLQIPNRGGPSIARQKQSRELLLPASQKGMSTPPRKPIADIKQGPGSLGVRGSFERMWKRGNGMLSSDIESGSRYRDSLVSAGDESGYDSVTKRSLDDDGRSAVIVEMNRIHIVDTIATPVVVRDFGGEKERSPNPSISLKRGGLVDEEPTRDSEEPAEKIEYRRQSRTSTKPSEMERIDITGRLSSEQQHQISQISPRLPTTPQSRHAHFGSLPQANDSKTSHTKSSFFSVHRRIAEPSYLVPVYSGQNSKPIRNHSLLTSGNKWLFGGRILLGGDSPLPFLGALILLLGIAAVWFSTTCVWWWNRGHGGAAIAGVGAYMCLLTLGSMLMTATRDPGILPRDLDPDPPIAPTTSNTSESDPPVPLPRDLKVRSGSVRVKYCVTCKTYRPPRSSHCKLCDNCVDGCDHHCQWVNNCVGRRNYTYFITFVVTASLTLMLVLATAILHLYYLTRDEGYTFKAALGHAPGSAVAVGLCLVVVWPLLALTLYHVRLLLFNITTLEQVRNQAHKKLSETPIPSNPFTLGKWHHNLAYLLCRPAGYSWVDPSGYATQDTRKINPGFIVTRVDDDDDEGTGRGSRPRSSSVGGDGTWKESSGAW